MVLLLTIPKFNSIVIFGWIVKHLMRIIPLKSADKCFVCVKSQRYYRGTMLSEE